MLLFDIMKYILVTGGLGFIGSHTCVELLNNDYNIIVVDNLVNSTIIIKDKIEEITRKKILFYQYDLLNKKNIWSIFNNHTIIGVIHLAGLKSVSESITNPLLYYDNNLTGTINLLECMLEFNCYNLIFSSSATVYGTGQSPLTENSDVGIGITNPYGRTKYMIENILMDISKSDLNFKITALRYFNPVGAHTSGLIGESPTDIPNNLMPYILKVGIHNNIRKLDDQYNYLSIYGGDYDTIDGTGVRDYIHVVDLAEAHVKALQNNITGYNVYNLGTGKGTSVLDLVKTFEKINNIKIPYKIISRRIGDLPAVYCDNNLAFQQLNWTTKNTLVDVCKDSWHFITKNEFS